MQRKLKFTPTAEKHYATLRDTPADVAIFKQVQKALGYLEVDPQHQSLSTHEFTSLTGANGEKVFEAYAQNNTPGAYLIFWHYGPDETVGKKRIPVITILAIEPHS